MSVDTHGADQLSPAECLELLATTRVGRIAHNDPAGPTVVPVNFAVHRDAVLIRSVPGSKVQAAESDEPVSFEADGLDVRHRSGWSVLVRGRFRPVTGDDDLPDPDSFVAGPDDPLLWLDPTEMTGRRLPVAPADPRSWDEEMKELGNVWFGTDATDLLG